MLKILPVLVFAACGAGAPSPSRDIHNIGGCSSDWSPPSAACEQACAVPPNYTSSTGCRARNPVSASTVVVCSQTFDLDDVAGCCMPWTQGDGDSAIRFFECD